MKTANSIYYFCGQPLTQVQYNLLSWLATVQFNSLQDNKTDQFSAGKLQGIESACTFANIPDLLIYEVCINHNFNALRNFNRMSEIKVF